MPISPDHAKTRTPLLDFVLTDRSSIQPSFRNGAETALGMSSIATVNGLKSKNILAIVISAVLPVVVGSMALAAAGQVHAENTERARVV